ncbi:MAG: hypothetical protein M1608_13250 [Candidatus Omnitrophica bacterium]|nr:hypothetical protein [Candidatus Omnitrophota bacterium]
MISLLLGAFGMVSLTAQPIVIHPEIFTPQAPNGFSYLRVAGQTNNGTELLLVVNYVYNGLNGPTAKIVPVIKSSRQKGIAAWFETEPVTIGQGRGQIALRIKYLNDKPGVPPQFTSDRIEILLLNSSGNSIIGTGLFLRTIHWGGKPKP